jgi:hypothetical protein
MRLPILAQPVGSSHLCFLLFTKPYANPIGNHVNHVTNIQPHMSIKQNTEQPTKKEEYNQQVNISNALLNNLCVALESASIDKTSTKHNTLNTTDHPAKRMKLESGEAGPTRDVYNILDPSFAKGTDVVHVPGAIIARLTIGGLMNALAGRCGGVVDTNSAKPIEGSDLEKKEDAPIAVGVDATTNAPMTATLALIQNKALGLSHLIAARLEVDMMQSTPKRIVDMLCPELTVVEVVSVRRRIYDTVVLGKGTNASANAEALESKDDLPVAARTGMHDIDKVCVMCSFGAVFIGMIGLFGNRMLGMLGMLAICEHSSTDSICTDSHNPYSYFKIVQKMQSLRK